MAPPVKHPMDYELVKRLAAEGLTQVQIARILNINIKTFENRIFQDPDLQFALRAGKALPNQLVEQSLFRNALGFPSIKKTYVRQTTNHVNSDGSVTPTHEMVLDKYIEEHTAGNVAAEKLWLECNYPEKYRARIDINHSFASMSKVANSGE